MKGTRFLTLIYPLFQCFWRGFGGLRSDKGHAAALELSLPDKPKAEQETGEC